MKKLLLILSLLFLVGCSDPPKSGYVVQKNYDDPDSWVYLMPTYTTMCNGTGAYRSCYQFQTGTIPIHQSDGPHWEFRIKDDADPKGKKHGWVEVDQESFDKYEVGMHWPDAR